MSTRRQIPDPDAPKDPADREIRSADDPGSTGAPALSGAAARLRAIHDLVGSGDYHVPAALIADRMIEQMMTEKRGHGR